MHVCSAESRSFIVYDQCRIGWPWSSWKLLTGTTRNYDELVYNYITNSILQPTPMNSYWMFRTDCNLNVTSDDGRTMCDPVQSEISGKRNVFDSTFYDRLQAAVHADRIITRYSTDWRMCVCVRERERESENLRKIEIHVDREFGKINLKNEKRSFETVLKVTFWFRFRRTRTFVGTGN